MKKIKILFLAANPAATQRLALDHEARAIEDRIRSSEFRNSLELVTKWAVRPDDLLQALNEYKPEIVHFSAHGEPTEGIQLEGANGMSHSVSHDTLRDLFAVMKDNVRVVVFNACFSSDQAEAITEHIDCAVGMTGAVPDEAAIDFAASLYRAIGFGRSIQNAFDQGILSLKLKNIPGDKLPQLHLHAGVEAEEIVLVAPETDEAALRASKESAERLSTGADPMLTLWKERLAFFHRELAVASSAADNSALQQQVKEAEQTIRQLESLESPTQSLWADVEFTRRSVANLILLPLPFALLLLWSYVHTDWPVLVVGSAVAMLVLLVVLAGVVRPGGLSDRLSRQLWETLIESKKTKWSIFPVLAIQLGLYFFVLGYLQIDYTRAPSDETDPPEVDGTIWIFAADDLVGQENYTQALDDAELAQIPSGQSLRRVYWLRPFSGRELIIKPKGCPDRLETIRPFRLCRLSCPEQFQNRIRVYLRPASTLMGIVLANPMEAKIWVTRDGLPGEPKSSKVKFSGNAVWIGCDETVPLPKRMKDEIEADLKDYFAAPEDSTENVESPTKANYTSTDGGYGVWKHLWETPSHLPDRLELNDRDELHVQLIKDDGKPYDEYVFAVEKNMIGNEDLTVRAFGYPE